MKRTRRIRHTPDNYASTVAKLALAERAMLLAVRKWDRLRSQARRMEKKLDAHFNERHASLARTAQDHMDLSDRVSP